MSCTHHRQVALHWSPSGPDLPDATALHLDACPDCRATFDHRFAPVNVAQPAAPRAKSIRWSLVLAAAAVVLLLPLGPTTEHEAPDLRECVDEIVAPPICEP